MHPEFYFKVNLIWDFSAVESTAVKRVPVAKLDGQGGPALRGCRSTD